MARLRPYFPKSHGVPRVNDRRVLSGIISINCHGLRWCDAPKEYGPANTLYNRWKRWSDMGVFAKMMTGLAAQTPDGSVAKFRNSVVLPGLSRQASQVPEAKSGLKI